MSSNFKIRNPEGVYFITFATHQWVDVFTRPCYLNSLIESLKFCQREKGLELFAYVIMSNHVHFIARSNKLPLQDIIRDFKKYTSVEIIKQIQDNPNESRKNWMLWIFGSAGRHNPNNTHFQLWQQEYHAIELYSNAVIDTKINYIHQNPVRAGIVVNPEDYLHSSARNYLGYQDLIIIQTEL
jgi:putative transposase